jgi:hypothetical protein
MRRLGLELCGIAVAALLIAGCNGSSSLAGSDTSGSTTTTESAAGLWSGTDSASGLTMVAVINSTGQADFIRSDGTQFVGTVQVSGDSIASTLGVYVTFGNAFGDNSTHGLGTLSGTVTSSGTMSANVAYTTDGGTAVSGVWSLSYATLSTTVSSLSAISANYTDGTTGAVVSISGTGQMTSQDSNTGCVLNGTVSTTTGGVDAYLVAYNYESCGGTSAVLNGVPFTGLAVLNPDVSPAQVIIGVSGQSTQQSTTVYYGIVSYLNAT